MPHHDVDPFTVVSVACGWAAAMGLEGDYAAIKQRARFGTMTQADREYISRALDAALERVRAEVGCD